MDIVYQVSKPFVDIHKKTRSIGDFVSYPDYYGTNLADRGYLIRLTPGALSTEQRIRGIEEAAPRLEALESVIPSTDPQVKFTPEGGLAVRMMNKTGGVSVAGTVVAVYDATAIDGAVAKIVVDVPAPIGAIYESGIADGEEVWVVVSGIAHVLFIGNTTRNHLARGFITGDGGYVAGSALSEAVPTSPFADDKHFYEIGHVLESRVGAGLAKCVLHFN